jgi:hypothetical protein
MGWPDCELIHRSALIAQPVNAWSSLAFALVCGWILVRALRGDHGRTPELVVFGLAVGVNAIGSFAYHGLRVGWGHWAHDMGIYAVLAFVAIHAFGTVRGWARRNTLSAFAASLAILGVLRWTIPGANDAISGLLAGAAAVGELFAWRSGLRPRRSDELTVHLAAWTLALGAMALGCVSFLLGSKASPLCHPDSLFQWHALWHVLQAVAMMAYAYAAVELWSPADAPEEARRHLNGTPTAPTV